MTDLLPGLKRAREIVTDMDWEDQQCPRFVQRCHAGELDSAIKAEEAKMAECAHNTGWVQYPDREQCYTCGAIRSWRLNDARQQVGYQSAYQAEPKPASPFKPNGHYKTRDGREARVYATDGGDDEPIHGAIRDGTRWEITLWHPNGRWVMHQEGGRDLMPPTRKVTKYLNVWLSPSGAASVALSDHKDAGVSTETHRLVVDSLPVTWDEPA